MAFSFDQKHYVPALKWRQGEYKALATLAGDVKEHVTPLLEIAPIPWDHEDEQPQRTIDQHLAPMPQQLETNWGKDYAFLDCNLVGAERVQGVTHPVEWMATNAAQRGLRLIPVTALDRDAAYQAAVGICALGKSRQVAIRIGTDDIFDDQVSDLLTGLLETLNVLVENVHIIIDLQYVDASTAGVLLKVLPKQLNAIDALGKARTLTLLGTAFPVDLSDVNPGVGAITRAEWALWTALRTKKLFRVPTFGDYSIAHFDTREIDPRTMRVSASIRYTGKSEWHIFRGHWLRNPNYSGFDQYRDLSNAVIQHPEYSGSTFSWGDDFIYKCANGTGGTGNLSQWRQVGNSHHITFAVRQIASLP